MNKLGETELQNTDKTSWVSKNEKGDVQLLFWDFTNTHPGDKVLNQTYYLQDLPSKQKGIVKIELDNLVKGKYNLEIYKVGYKVHDVYADYLAMNSPKQLSKEQVKLLKEKNNDCLLSTEKIKIDSKGTFNREIAINENDVYMFRFVKQ